MSCYNWERGSFVLSTAEYRRFRDEFIVGVNKLIEHDFKLVERLYSELLEKKKTAKRGTSWQDIFNEVFHQNHDVSRYGYSFKEPKYSFKKASDWDVRRALFLRIVKAADGRNIEDCSGAPLKPKKKDFAPLVATKVASVSADGDEGCVSFDAKKRLVVWRVSENNRAVERARESNIGRLFFDLLRRVKWTRGTGGSITGNDEYNREDDSPGGGGNQLKESFGPLGEADREDQYGALRRKVKVKGTVTGRMSSTPRLR